MVNDVPPIVSVTFVLAMSTVATALPEALNTWILPAVPRLGGEGKLMRSGGSGHTPWLLLAGKSELTPVGRPT
jgi:hypothetical protein